MSLLLLLRFFLFLPKVAPHAAPTTELMGGGAQAEPTVVALPRPALYAEGLPDAEECVAAVEVAASYSRRHVLFMSG